MPEDILMAVVNYLTQIMSTSLNAVVADYLSAPTAPYAVVHDGPETYTDASGNDGSNGPILIVYADGVLFVEFVAPTKVAARRLARQCVRILVDTFTTLECQDGTILSLFPVKADSVPMTDIGVATPGAFKRFVTISYRQEFPSPGFPGG
jgi:hypothetical protein